MEPCAGIGPGCVPGLVVRPPGGFSVIGHRGFPFPVIYLQVDEDGASTYEGYTAGYTAADLVIYSILAFGLLMICEKTQRRSQN